MSSIRIGQGYDVHRFGEGDHIVLGGVKLPYKFGFIAHSDGDVLIHAICDALLGALALGDIGKHFPDNDDAFENMDSRVFLRHIASLVIEKGYRVNNLDSTIVAQAPKMAPFIDEMRRNLAEDLSVAIDQINVKATTTERLGFEGRKEGISCQAICLLSKRDSEV